MYNKPVVSVISRKYNFCGLADSVQLSSRLNACIQTVKVADIKKKKPQDGTFGSPPPQTNTSLWLKPLALQPKDTQWFVVVLNKMRYCIRQRFNSTVLLRFRVFYSHLYLACQLKHSQFLHEVAVETHLCRKPVHPARYFCSLSFSAHLKRKCPLPSMYSCLHSNAPN